MHVSKALYSPREVKRLGEEFDRRGVLVVDDALLSRLAFILYLNPVWDTTWGGHLRIRTRDRGWKESRLLQPHESSRDFVAVAPSVFATDSGTISVTVSLGVALLNHDTLDFETLIDEADQAMHKAKRSGRNQVVLHDTAEDRYR